jgi:hypothetical protein
MHEVSPVGESKQLRGVLSRGSSRLQVACRVIHAAGLGALLMLAALGAPAACSGDASNGGAGGGSGGSAGAGGNDGVDGGGNEDTSTSCAVATGIDKYVAHLSKPGRNGVYSFQLVQSDPAPPAEGTNVWMVKVLGSDGVPIANDQLSVDIFMPGHGHNTPIPPIVAYDVGAKTFAINPVHFSMGGTWRITFSVFDPSDRAIPIDSAQFFFCLD